MFTCNYLNYSIAVHQQVYKEVELIAVTQLTSRTREQVEVKYFSEWKDQLKELVSDRISNLKGHVKYLKCKVPDQPDTLT